jgi:hypothetical protein
VSNLDRHVYPTIETADIAHDPESGPFYTGNFAEGCWSCENQCCVQRISYVNEITGAKVIVHGVLRQ